MATDESTLLPFQRYLLSTLIPTAANPKPDDALLILARGLGIRSIIANYLKVYNTSDHLVLVLNATEEEERGLKEGLGMGLKIIGHEMPASARTEIYKSGGLLSVTSRILIVDMLDTRKIIPVDLITGIVVLHAEDVTPASIEHFIISKYRNENKTGFIKAFSDDPERFTAGLSPLQTILTSLHIREVYIWPRFREEVTNDLLERKVDVQELYQPLSESMRDIQTGIIECMDANLSEIKKSNTKHLDIEDLNVENALFRSFDALVRRQLDPVWHQVGPRTKQLVGDLTTLRKLQLSLLDYDCVSFNRFLETILSANTINQVTGQARVNQSPWLLTTAASTIFAVARDRVYIQHKIDKPALPKGKDLSSSVTIEEGEDEIDPAEAEAESVFDAMMAAATEESRINAPISEEQMIELERKAEEAEKRRGLPPGAEPILEEQPKWALLAAVLDEIENELHWAPVDLNGVSNNTILVMCNSSATCATLSNYLSTMTTETGASVMMGEKLRDYFKWKAHLGQMVRNLKKNKGGSSKNSNKSFNKTGDIPVVVDDEPVVIQESAAMKKKREMAAARGKAPSAKRRRIRGGGNIEVGNGRVTLAESARADPDALEAEAGEIADLMMPATARMSTTTVDVVAPSYLNANEASTDLFDEAAFSEYFGLLSNETLVIVRPHGGDDDDRMLEELRPKYVILYDPDPAFVRRMEILRASHRGLATRVYFMMYKDSVEEQRYLSSIRKEKNAFERLIRERQTMAIPLQAEYRAGEVLEQNLRTVSSRVGGKQARSDQPRVIVDVREFRSSLPSLLYAGHFDVIPLTISVGDYIITPEMCVERKSLPDLIQSFNSGRLYQQCEIMTAHYKQPILLIEFDEKKSFSLETYAEPNAKGADYTSEIDVRSKLVLLTISFPRLKIIWSSSPFNTVEIFRDLKENREEPDADKAVLVGGDEADGGAAAEGTAEAGFLQAPQDILRSLPGITSKNYHHVMSKVDSIDKLVELELKEVQELVGVEAGRTLFLFINREMTSAS